MAVDAVKLAPKVDAVVLATGDGDFVPLVEYLKNSGTQVEVIAFGKSASQRLKESVDDFIDMSSDPKKFLMGRNILSAAASAITGEPEEGTAEPRVVGAD
jgi:uncharacterized LabA/DUF88 family protein